MKTILQLLACSFILTSCVKDLEIKSSHQQPEIVVNCLFSTANNWDVQIMLSKNLNENVDQPVENAEVIITPENGDAIALSYQKKGHYTSDLKPTTGNSYQLEVNVPGYPPITAASSIPDTVTARVQNLRVNWATYMFPNDLMDYDVFPVEVSFAKAPNGFLFFRSHLFNPEYGYSRYKLPSSALDELRAEGIPEKGIERLANYTDEWYIKKEVFTDCIDDLGDFDETLNYRNLLSQKLKIKKVSQREYNAFYRTSCFADSEWLTNLSYDTYTVLGAAQGTNRATILYAEPNLKYAMENEQKQNREYWLEITTGSPAYYEYYRTYILQVSQRINPYSEPVAVYSNIENSVGIFAGYNRQMIHLFDY